MTAPAQTHPEASSYSPAYRIYVLGVLLVTYIVNVMDRGVLASLLHSISVEFELTDGQLGFLSSVPFALFYSVLGIPIAAFADRTVRKNVLAAACALAFESDQPIAVLISQRMLGRKKWTETRL